MRRLMGVIKDRNGTYYAQQRVPDRLQKAVARILGKGKPKQVFLKRSLGTKVLKDANTRAKPVQIEFDRIIREAEALEKSKPPTRATLTNTEISRMAEYVYAKELQDDERTRVGGRDEYARIAELARREYLAEGRNPDELVPLWRYEDLPKYGLSAAQLTMSREHHVEDLADLRDALALSNIAAVEHHVADALDAFGINLGPNSPSYPTLGIAVLRAYVRALEDIGKRNDGHPVETPALQPATSSATEAETGATLREAFEGWKKVRVRPDDTLSEYNRAVEMFIELHGNLAVAIIKRRHALEFREAIQLVPRHRGGALRNATLPELVEWAKKHPDAPRVAAGTINKQLGALQAVCMWAHMNGLMPDDIVWADPFHRMRLEEDESDRAPFAKSELQVVFDDPLFTAHEWPVGARGAAGFWLPLLALFTGARQAEIGGLRASNITKDEATGTPLMYIVRNTRAGRRLKTKSSARAIPIHSQLVELGFLQFVAKRRREGADAWLFPRISPETGRAGIKAWSKWFGRYLRDSVGVKDTAKVFHSFRHGVKDALRRARVDYELREALVGHSHGNTVSGGYGAAEMLARWGVEALQEAISKITYPGLDLSRVRPLETKRPHAARRAKAK
jgi:integrase